MSAAIQRAPEPRSTCAQPRRCAVDDRSPTLDAVLAVESAAYRFPLDPRQLPRLARRRLPGQVLVDGSDGELLGYFVAMKGVDEMHLLNITVAPAWQRHGHARLMLDALVQLCRDGQGAQAVARSAREQRPRARHVPAPRLRQVGVRKATTRRRGRREDAIVMSLDSAAPEAADALD